MNRGSLNSRLHEGYTILELMITLAILGIIVTIAAPRIGHGFQGAHLKTSARQFAGALRAARSIAVTQNARVSVFVPIGGSEYIIACRKTNVQTGSSAPENGESGENRDFLPSILNEPLMLGEDVFFLEFYTDSEASHTLDDGVIEFFPRGNSTGGTVVIAINSGPAYAVTIDRLTGRVMIGPV